MTSKLFPPRGPEGPPSTQFAATIMAMPELDDAVAAARAEAGHPDSVSPDTLATDGSFGEAASPDVVTDIGGLPSEVPDPADAPTISHIGRYALKRQLGAGGLGSVFEAWDPLLSRAVAVKTLQFDVDANARSSLDGLFLNEARAAAGLNHRYIVTIHDAGLSPHGVYIAMERLYGRDLQRALAEGWRPTVEQVMQLVRRVTEALAYAHARGVVHCDIKPANIFLQRRDKPKVLDFGIARIVHGAALPALEGAVVGSPRYRAPEQLDGGTVDARTDLYSLGVVTYELLTGRRAFEGDTLAEINTAVLHGAVRPAHEVDARVPREVSDMVTRMMARSPADRYTCASELSMDLRSWVQSFRDGASPAAAAAPARSRGRPSQATPVGGSGLLTAALIVAAVAALVAGVLAWQSSPRQAAARLEAPAALPAPSTMAPAAQGQALPVAPIGAGGADAQGGTAQAAAAAPAAQAAEAGTALDRATTAPSASAQGAGATAPGAAAQAAEAAGKTATARPGAAADRSAAAPAARARQADSTGRNRLAPAADSAAREGRTDADAAATGGSGALQLAVSPWGQVEVDGQPAGTTPPLTRLTLPVGTHTITLRNADFAPHTVQVQVSADKPVTLRHRFGS